MPCPDRAFRSTPARLALAAAALLAAATTAGADEIVTRTGGKFRGKIVSEDATHIVIETADVGTLRIPRADVATVDGVPVDARAGAAGGKATGNADAAAAKDASPEQKPGATQKPDAASKSGPAQKPAVAQQPGPAPKPAAAPADSAEARKKAEEEAARKRAEQEALDAAERIARRKAASIRRRTAPGAGGDDSAASPASPTASAPAAPAPASPAAPSAAGAAAEATPRAREGLGGADLATMAPASQVVVFEPSHPFAAGPAGIALGRRTWARLDRTGTTVAMLTATVAGRDERMTLRLADVQRAVSARNAESRVRLLEGVEEGDWVRLRLDDGTTSSGRFVSVGESAVTLRVPSADGAPANVDVEAARIVQADGLRAAFAVSRAINDLEPGEAVGVILWPDGREIAARFVDRMEHHLRLDSDGDGEPETIVPVDAPVAELRRLPPGLRKTMAALAKGAPVKLRGFEQYPDARVERTVTAPLAAVTAFAVSVKLADGCVVVPVENLVSCEAATGADVDAWGRRLGPDSLGLPVLPGAPVDATHGRELPKGVSLLTDGRTVTHVYVAPPFDGPVCGMRVGEKGELAITYTDLFFGATVQPTGEGERRREHISETVEGLRVTAYVDGRGSLAAIEVTRR